MKNWICGFLGAGLLALGLPAWAEERSTSVPSNPSDPSGPLDLSGFTRGDFTTALATVGPGKLKPGGAGLIGRMPLESKPGAGGLSRETMTGYMLTARRRFESGEAVSVADVSLDSSLDTRVRQPMLNYISLFTNELADVYLLVQKPWKGKTWSYYSIVQDKTVTPNVAYYGDVLTNQIHLRGAECYKCHASGPRVVRPFRPDLVSDAAQAQILNHYLTDHGRSLLHFPADEPRIDYGPALSLPRCAKCHSDSGDQGPLHRVHGPSIRALVDHGYMPPKGTLTAEERSALMVWLEGK